MDLKNIQWGEFFIEDLFFTKIGKSIDGNKINKKSGKVAYITRKESNNGLDGFINDDKSMMNNDFPVITIGNETAEPFVQNSPFFTGTKVNILKPKSKISKYSLAFIAQCLKGHKAKFSYSFTINSTRLKRQKILLPITLEGEPDYAFMEQFMQQKEQEKLEKFQNYVSKRIDEVKDFQAVEPLNEKEWGEFKLQDLFNFEKGNQNNMTALKRGSVPLISAKKGENGLKNLVSKNNKKIFSKNCLTLNNDGDGGAGISYYQPYSFLLDSHVTCLYSKENLNKPTLLFITRCITKQRGKFGHGYALTDNRLKAFKLMLPINQNGNPDYEYMENYIKKLEFEKLMKYLSLKQ